MLVCSLPSALLVNPRTGRPRGRARMKIPLGIGRGSGKLVSKFPTMKIITADQVHAALRFPDFIDALQESFAGHYTMPPRQVMLLDEASGSHDAFAMLPSWNDEVIALKAFTYFPGNQPPHRSLYSQIMVFDRSCGEPLGAGGRRQRDLLADRRGFGAGVAVSFPPGFGNAAFARHGETGAVPHPRPCQRPPAEKGAHLGPLAGQGGLSGRNDEREIPALEFDVAADLATACGQADIVVCATGSTEILVRGEWIRPGTHTDFLGNHHATKRECDTAMVTRSRVFVDTTGQLFQGSGRDPRAGGRRGFLDGSSGGRIVRSLPWKRARTAKRRGDHALQIRRLRARRSVWSGQRVACGWIIGRQQVATRSRSLKRWISRL